MPKIEELEHLYTAIIKIDLRYGTIYYTSKM